VPPSLSPPSLFTIARSLKKIPHLVQHFDFDFFGPIANILSLEKKVPQLVTFDFDFGSSSLSSDYQQLQPTTSSAVGWKGANVLAVLGAIKTPPFGGEKYPTNGEECF
jgi:hypothetical protein